MYPLKIKLPDSSKSKVAFIGFTCIGEMISESLTLLGTTSTIRWRRQLQVLRKPAPWFASLVIVALLSLSYNRRSLREETLKEVTRGPPWLPVPFRYSWTTRGSNTSTVLSKWIPPAVLFGVTASGPTTVGKPPYFSLAGCSKSRGVQYMMNAAHSMAAGRQAN